MNHDQEQLIQQALAVLHANWTGSFTKPSAGLYPHQWSWDAAWIAMGSAHFDQSRAQQELRSLFQSQWTNGLLPHIVFDPHASHYFPGPECWKTEGLPFAPAGRLTSGIVQPPIHATAALSLYRSAENAAQARAFLSELFPRLKAWHGYLYRERDPQGEALVYIRHPWESGQDNSPVWDPILRRMQLRPEEVPAYRRLDTQVVDAQHRPSQAEYDRYVYLVNLFVSRGYDEGQIRHSCPFLVQDVLFNALLCQANRDLAEIAHLIGEDGGPFEIWAEQTAQAMNRKLWDEEHGIYLDWDLVSGELIPSHVTAGFVPLFAGIPDLERALRMYAYLNSPAFCSLSEAGCYAVPSYNRQAPDFSPTCYWRGPVWFNLNWLLYQGMLRYGLQAYAQRLRQAIIELARQHGFYEYFNPFTGCGHGTERFSWSAAVLLHVLSEREQ